LHVKKYDSEGRVEYENERMKMKEDKIIADEGRGKGANRVGYQEEERLVERDTHTFSLSLCFAPSLLIEHE
jgi:hypothetical protein